MGTEPARRTEVTGSSATLFLRPDMLWLRTARFSAILAVIWRKGVCQSGEVREEMREGCLYWKETADRSSYRTFECVREAANGFVCIGKFRRASTDNAGVSRGMGFGAYGSPVPSYLLSPLSRL